MPTGKKEGSVPRETNRAERNYADRQSPKRYSEVIGQPGTVQEMLAFLGLCGYSRTYVPEYVNLTQPFNQALPFDTKPR